MKISDKQIFKKIKKGDIKAFELFFKQNYKVLCNYAFHYLKNAQDAEEVVQDIFFIIWKNRKELNIKSIKSYLFQSVKNNCLQQIRHKSLNDKYKSFVKHSYKENSEQADKIINAKEMNEIIEKTLNSLPERCKQIFKLSRYEGLKYREIAKKLSISIKTVEANMGKALMHFRNNLKAYIEV
ncbi:MAG: RNA polymerase sigma-70 factor [Bacteroidetes bacterium]|nr:RNA polymerase sigma-70 factor [Bacteroidota bacterium]